MDADRMEGPFRRMLSTSFELRRPLRAAFVILLLINGLVLMSGLYTVSGSGSDGPEIGSKVSSPPGSPIVYTQAKGGPMVIVDSSGRVSYTNDTYTFYGDLDPVSEDEILYVAADRLNRSSPLCSSETCTKQIIEVLNTSTDEVTRLFSYVNGTKVGNNEIHDADLINGTHLVLGELSGDAVWIVDYRSGDVTWRWNGEAEYRHSSGGPYPEDWMHLNDVEVLPSGSVMTSLRNQDSVVFLHPGEGMLRNMTIGEDDRHGVLYEQHNPDYLRTDGGGGAVLIADSENNRIVEYERRDGGWVRTWLWRDATLDWPRDADRLPDGNTLISDTHGDRIFEVNETGAIVWQLKSPHVSVYEAEKIGTGDESTGGTTASELGLESRSWRPDPEAEGVEASDDSLLDRTRATLRSVIPNRLWHGIAYVLPGWMEFYHAVLLFSGVVSGMVWAAAEIAWFTYGGDPSVSS